MKNRNFAAVSIAAFFLWAVQCNIDSISPDAPTPYAVKGLSHLDSLKNAYVDMKFGMFLHFNMNTFAHYNPTPPATINTAGTEWDVGHEDENLFHPESLNCGQWADVGKSAGCKYVVLTTKHHGGFLLWPSNTTGHGITGSNWYKENPRDVVREFVDSTRSRGMKPGFYYSVWDRTNGWAIPLLRAQLTELLTNYGDVVCIWFDGWYWASGVGYYKVPYDTLANLIHNLQPNCLIVENNHLFVPKFTEIVEYEVPIDGPPQASNTYPAEGNEPIRNDNCWFWHPDRECDIRTPATIIERISVYNSRNASYLLDLTPDTLGLIPQCEKDVMKEVGRLRGVQ